MLFVSGLMVAIAVEHSNLHRRWTGLKAIQEPTIGTCIISLLKIVILCVLIFRWTCYNHPLSKSFEGSPCQCSLCSGPLLGCWCSASCCQPCSCPCGSPTPPPAFSWFPSLRLWELWRWWSGNQFLCAGSAVRDRSGWECDQDDVSRNLLLGQCRRHRDFDRWGWLWWSYEGDDEELIMTMMMAIIVKGPQAPLPIWSCTTFWRTLLTNRSTSSPGWVFWVFFVDDNNRFYYNFVRYI